MSHLNDMEELVNDIIDTEVKNYMKEAMSCYMAGAYRACIVLTYIALFDDIVKKLKELGQVNKKARNLSNEIEKRINSQEVYESYLIDQLKSNNLLPSLDGSFLDILRILRNKSAHPSGHNASAEEARFIFYEAISRFLSKQILTTTQLVDDILARLNGKHFFPSTDIDKISSVVKKELQNIHTEAYPYLINKFLEKNQSDNDEISKNAGFFITGLAYSKESESTKFLKKYILEAKSSDENYSLLILRLISANSELITDLDDVVYERLRAILNNRIQNVEDSLEHTRFSHPACVISSILKVVGEDILCDNFDNELNEFISRNILSKYFVGHIDTHEKVVEKYFNVLCEQAGSTDFNTANKISRNINDLDSYLSKILAPKQTYILILNILTSASHGAWGASSLRDSKFSSIPETKEQVLKFLAEDEDTAKELYINYFSSIETYEKNMKQYIHIETEEDE